MFLTGLVSLFDANAPLVALVGANIFPVLMPEDVTLASGSGALTYQVTGGSADPTFETSGMQKVRIQFDAFGVNYPDAANIREAVRIALNGFQGLLSDGTWLQNAVFLQNIDFYNNDARQFRCAIEFYLYFNFTL